MDRSLQTPPSPERQAILAVLRGAPWSWPPGDVRFKSAFDELLTRERLGPLLAHLLEENPSLAKDWPEEVRQSLHTRRRQQVARELATAHSVNDIVTDLARRGVFPVLLKGTALAYWCYPCAEARPRCDVDFLARRRDVAVICEVFERHGYRFGARGIVGQEFQYRRVLMGYGLEFDVHWRISAGLLLAHALTYEEMLAESISIPALGEQAIGLSPRHALLHACLHWARHRADGDHISILWLYDMHLLVNGMTSADLLSFARLALDKKLASICAAALESARSQLGTALDPMMCELLRSAPKTEPGARLLRTGARRLEVSDAWSKRSVSAWRDALLDMFVPPPAYLRRQSGAAGDASLLNLYLKRILKAIGLALPGLGNQKR
jgi:hypothetical protein